MLAAAARMLASKPFSCSRAANQTAQSPLFSLGRVSTATSFARLQHLAKPIASSPRQLSHFCSCSHERYTSVRSVSTSAHRKYNNERVQWSQSNPCRGLFSRARKQEEEDRKALGVLTRAANGAVAPPLPLSDKETKAFARELHTVNVAITANGLIFVAKLAVYLASGSSAILAESIHSLADIGNQILLRTGIQRSKKAPSALHPYGYMKDKFVWSLISAVGIFCLGAGVTVVHGFHGLFVQQQLEHLTAGLSVLGVSLLLEGYSLLVAVRTVTAGAAAAGLPFAEFVRRGMDPTSIAVMMEDGAACAGLLIAGVATYVAWYTGNSIFDAIGSISVGCLLGATAVFLIQRNRQLLIACLLFTAKAAVDARFNRLVEQHTSDILFTIFGWLKPPKCSMHLTLPTAGRAMNIGDMAKVLKHLRRDPVVKAVYDAKSEEIGPGIYRFKAEIDFSGEQVVQRHMTRLGRESLYTKIESATVAGSRTDLELVLQDYGKDMVGALGAEVDRLENEVRELVPGLRHIDLETDRGGRATSSGSYDEPYYMPSLLPDKTPVPQPS